MADIDFFKKVNANYGHLIGDKVLKDFAKLILESIRDNTDWVARYGGEEFLIVLNNTDVEGAYKVAEKIRKLVAKKMFIYEDKEFKITSSFGVYGFKNMKVDFEELIEIADKNLYKAKNSGRNKTV